MKINVVHDSRGEIVSIARIGDLAQAGSRFTRAGLLPGHEQSVAEVELSDEQAARPLREIHASHRVDPVTCRLVRKDS